MRFKAVPIFTINQEDQKMDKILEILNEINDSIDYENEDALIDDELIDSVDLTGLISELEDAFDVEIGMEEIIPENFNSVEAMWDMIQRLR